MALADLQAYLQERLAAFDETIDLTPGSPADTEVVQPVLRRLGSDPFTIDMGVFLQDRLNQEFPDLPTKEGDALTDLLIKPAIVLWDPLVRENFRIRQQMSFRDATIMTLDESEALAANLFAERNKGNTARGVSRLYFARPQGISIGPANFITSKGGLHFFPTETQSIAVEEMLFNLEGDLYYFDVNVVAENPGEEYNIGPDELITIANVSPAVRVTNKNRFRFGMPAETAVDFIDRVEQDLTERSMVTERGIVAKVAKSFTDVTRIAVTGFRDPEMNRDVITGGGLGLIELGGLFLQTITDGEGALRTRRVSFNSISEGTTIDFTDILGPPGQIVTNATLTVFDAFGSSVYPRVRDLKVKRVVSATVLDLEEQVLQVGLSNKAWTLRKSELTLSGIPGGILFPDTPDGRVSVPDDQVHIGGATDIFVRGADLDTGTLVLSSVVDDDPLLSGQQLDIIDALGNVTLDDLVLGVNYAVDDETYEALESAVGLTIQILDPPVAGSYRVLSVTHTPGSSPTLLLTPPPSFPIAATFRWRLLDELDIDLVEPKETKVAGSDLEVVQGQDLVETAGGTDFQSYGVGEGDVLRILTGALILGDYNILQVVSPLFTKVQLDRVIPATASGVRYQIFRKNEDGGIERPIVRVTSVDLLDTSNQPVGTTIPYAKPVDIRTRSFANASHGIKVELNDARLGLVSLAKQDGTFNLNTNTLRILWDTPTPVDFTVTFTAPCTTMAQVVAQINAAASAATGGAVTQLAVSIQDDLPFKRLGIVPAGANTRVTSVSVGTSFFGGALSSRAIRSELVPDWLAIRPAIDPNFDVAQVLDGLQIGFYASLVPDVGGGWLNTDQDLQPEIKRHVNVGSRSFGSARLFFLEPTSIEFGENAYFDVVTSDGTLRFIPDPTLNYQRIPALPSETKPKDGATTGSTFTSATADFVKRGIQPGDLLVIDYQPLAGSVALADPVLTLEFKILTLSISGGVDKDIIFVKDDVSIPSGSVTRAGVADQINKIVGQTICRINGTNNLEFEADLSIIVRGSGSANALLGFPGTDTNNRSSKAGEYNILTVPNATTLTVSPAFGVVLARQQFKVFRRGVQRIVSTQMAKNVAETGLHYFDVELVSIGTGDEYNIEAGLQMVAAGYRADGYYLQTDDPNLTFSPTEMLRMRVSPTILEVGTTDNPDNATPISGQNLQVNYEKSIVTGNVQNFAMSETERVICSSPLARHLIPHFVRFDLLYTGGSQESETRPDIERFIKGLFPNDFLEVSDLERLLSLRGAKSISNPITLLAVVHNFDRSIVIERSQDKLNTGRLAAFIPDVLTIQRKLG
jgi:hypothetical protein